MDSRYVPHIIQIMRAKPEVDLVKGNRFMDPRTLRAMPMGRLVGNAGLTFLVKFSGGYWTLVDPTNGYLGIRASALRETDISRLADRYFFEIDLLCAFGLRRRSIAELEMPPIYGAEQSSLSVRQALLTFPSRLMSRFLRRIVFQYLIIEMNFGSICTIVGLPLWLASLVFGGYEWRLSYTSGRPRATGTIILALLLFILGFQLLLQAMFFDVQFSQRTLKIRIDLESLIATQPSS
jgi:hypothetical protein